MSKKSPLQRLRDAFAQLTGGAPITDAAASESHLPIDAPGPIDEAVAEVVPTPRSILEAMLFVGHPNNEPLAGSEVSALMRDVSIEEIDSLVHELNEAYVARSAPYQIVREGTGFRMQLCGEFDRVRQKFLGRIREARLSRACVDVLAIVAYNQPISAESVQELRASPSGPFLSQLVRRRLLQIERLREDPKRPIYRTTDRFLRVFGLANLDDLPRSDQIEVD